jgi:sugar O-acyltransferase (sialic acid O-acetyltransferase NeuD family)
MENPVIILGAKGFGPVALDIFQSNEIIVYGFLDDDSSLHGITINDIPVYGATDDDGFLKLIGHKCEAFVATDEVSLKRNLVTMLNERRHIMPCNAIHGKASISNHAILGHGILIDAGAVVSTQVTVGNHVIIAAGTVIDYATTLGDYCQVSIGARIGSSCFIDEQVFIGPGAVIIPGITIGKKARIGAGSVVIENVPAGATYFGNPAKKV